MASDRADLTGTGRFITRMLIFVACVTALAAVLFPVIETAFFTNAPLNSVILGTLALGMGYILRQVLMLQPEIRWLEAWRRGQPPADPEVRLLAPMATMLGERRGRLSLSAMQTRSLLDSIGARLDEGREISRYLIGLMILLGLIGTFWGLMQTIGSVSDVVSGLTVAEADLAQSFDALKAGLAAPLGAMGTAFSSSLFGLAGSLVLGFLDIQAGQAANRFYNELEEWLSGQTRLGSSGVGDGDQSVPAFIQALLEQTADSLESLQRIIQRGEESRISANANLLALTDKLGTLSDQMRAEQSLLVKLVEGQLELRPILARLAAAAETPTPALDEASRQHLRSVDHLAGRLLEEMTQGRAQLTQDLRGEIRILARTIAALGAAEEAGDR